MSCLLCTALLLIVTPFVVLCDIDKNSSIDFYIVNSSCPQGHICLTLSQFAAKAKSFHGNDVNITLYFLPGHHYLDQKLSLVSVHNFMMTKDVQYGNDTVFVDCYEQGRFAITTTMFVSIADLQFIRCGHILDLLFISYVDQFILKDSIFHQDLKPVKLLTLDTVANASILRSLFSYSHQDVYIVGNMMTLLYSNHSVVNVANSTFGNIRGLDGGVMYIYSSSVTVTYSVFVNNTALRYGGVIAMSNSSFYAFLSRFVNNTAKYSGGVLHSSECSFHISYCHFRGNNAHIGGVLLDVKNSTNNIYFNNEGVYKGVKNVNLSLCQIISGCVFQYNVANAGGIMEITGNAILIKNCTFNRNNGSIYVFNSNITFGSQNTFENCIEPNGKKEFTVCSQ